MAIIVNGIKNNSISKVNKINHIMPTNIDDKRIDKVVETRKISSGISPQNLFMLKVLDLKNKRDNDDEKDIINNEEIANMTLPEFENYLSEIESLNNYGSFKLPKMTDEQILMLQDLLSSNKDENFKLIGTEPIIINEDIASKNIYEMKEFINENKDIFSSTGIIHKNVDDVNLLSDNDVIEIQHLLLSKLNKMSDLFYYNKAFSKYEQSYENMATFYSEGLLG